MQVSETSLPGVLIIKPRVFEDPRGFFMETYRQNALAEAGIARDICAGQPLALVARRAARIALSTAQSTGEALPGHAGRSAGHRGRYSRRVAKLRQVGECGAVGENHAELYIPKGFAHGFVVRSETADFLYKCSDYFEAVDDRGVLWNDPQIGINWETPDPILSNKDKDTCRWRRSHKTNCRGTSHES